MSTCTEERQQCYKRKYNYIYIGKVSRDIIYIYIIWCMCVCISNHLRFLCLVFLSNLSQSLSKFFAYSNSTSPLFL